MQHKPVGVSFCSQWAGTRAEEGPHAHRRKEIKLFRGETEFCVSSEMPWTAAASARMDP